MREKFKKYVLPVVLLGLAMFVYGIAISEERKLEHYEPYVLVQMTGRKISYEEARQAGKKLTVVGSGETVTIENPKLSRYFEGNAKYIAGNLNAFLPDVPMIDLTETANECVLSAKAAKGLFGTDQVEGVTVQCNGREYLVRGVTDYQIDGENEVVFSPAADSSILYDKAMYRKGENTTGNQMKQELSNLGIRGKMLDGGDVLLVIRTVMSIFLLVVGIAVTVLLHNCGKEKEDWKEKAIIWGCYLVVWGIILFLLTRQIRFPLQECPSRWSDFEAWSMIFSEKKESWKLYRMIKEHGIYREISKAGFHILCETIGASILFILGIKKIECV